jgi:SRSO17 transposase
LHGFIFPFKNLFSSQTRNVFESAKHYLDGLFSNSRSNCVAMGESSNFDSQRLHHLISSSVWNENELMDTIANNFVELVTNNNLADEITLLIDESGFAKKGNQSAGVKKQYNGQVGKLDNCQVGVFGALNAGSLTAIVNAKLHESVNGQTKIDLAKSIIDHVVYDLKIIPKCINADSFYGRDTGLLAYINSKKLNFIVDVPEGHLIYLELFQMRVPKSKSKRGRQPTIAKPNKESISIKRYAEKLKKKDFKETKIRHGSDGILKTKYHRTTVYILNKDSQKRLKVTLLIRKDEDGKRYYCLTNFDESTTLKFLAYYQSKRYFIERSFQDGKKNLGMRQYECRSSKAWHRHIVLCMLALLFIQHEKIFLYNEAEAYLSTEDIKKVIASLLEYTQIRIVQIIKNIIAKSPPTLALVKNKIYLQI